MFFGGDDDFKMLGLDSHCLPLDVSPNDEIERRTICIFQAWLKDWEEVNIKPNGDAVLEQIILRKHGGLLFVDPDLGKEFTVHHDQA